MERVLVHPKICVIRYQPMEELVASARNIFLATGPCPLEGFPDTRPSTIAFRKRSALLFSRWQIPLPRERIVLTRAMMGLE